MHQPQIYVHALEIQAKGTWKRLEADPIRRERLYVPQGLTALPEK